MLELQWFFSHFQHLRAMNKAALNVYQEKDKGTQEGVISTMQTRMELYDMLNYHAYEQKMDELFSKGKAK